MIAQNLTWIVINYEISVTYRILNVHFFFVLALIRRGRVDSFDNHYYSWVSLKDDCLGWGYLSMYFIIPSSTDFCSGWFFSYFKCSGLYQPMNSIDTKICKYVFTSVKL